MGAKETGARKSGRADRRERDVLHRVQGMSLKTKKAKTTPAAFLVQAEELLGEGRPDEALPIAKRALAGLHPDHQNPMTPTCLPALNLLAEVYLELGDGEAARERFLQAVDLDPEGLIPESDGGGAEKFLWLAQLSEDGGQDSVNWFEKGAEVLKREISNQLAENDRDPDDAVKATMNKLASALCGIIEIFMTDLSWDPAAETHCEKLITEALLSAPHSPSPLQTLASIRISQSRIPEAQKALSSSIDLWKDLPPEDSSVPDFSTRISLARLLMEVEIEEEALEVVERLVLEDDQSVEAWYLGGWCLYLLAQKKRPKEDTMDDGQSKYEEIYITSLLSSREWLKQSLTRYEALEYEDDRLRDHALELVNELDTELQGHDIDNVGEAENGIDDEWESGEAEDEDEGNNDDDYEEMDGT